MNNKEEDFSRIVKENKGTIYMVCYMFSKDQDEVDDMFQDVLLNLWKGYQSFREDSKVSTWLYRVALNTCISAERKKRHSTERLSMDINLYEDSDEDSRQVQQLHQLIGKLDVIDRAIVLMWLENMSYDEIAAILGVSAKNVSVKLVRIKEKLIKMNK
ncbi:MAG: sigma-70 family RNA polymerase sigma factor [Bacteroidaceae bacterium]|nr:sigma-70 family RNA polymerase sigma factor [Bacteroidaceae bacterium]